MLSLRLYPLFFKYFIINIAVVLVFPSTNGWTCQIAEVNLEIFSICSSKDNLL